MVSQPLSLINKAYAHIHQKEKKIKRCNKINFEQRAVNLLASRKPELNDKEILQDF